MIDDDGPIREGVPGEGRLVDRRLFGHGDERRKRGGAPAGVSQRPPGVTTGGQTQLGICGDGECPGGEVLNPVRLAGRNGGRSGAYQPPRLVLGIGAEFGGTLQRQRGGGRATPALRLSGGRLEQRRDLLVRIQRGGSQVPGSPVWLVVQGLGKLAVRCGALREGRRVVNGGPDQRVGEMQASAVYRDHVQLLGRREGLRV